MAGTSPAMTIVGGRASRNPSIRNEGSQYFQDLPATSNDSFFVLAGLDPAIHDFLRCRHQRCGWMRRSGPGM